MPKSDADGEYIISETGNWNVADSYAKLKIMKPLENCDHYANIAKFGHDTISEQLMNFSMPTDELKIMGFERLVHELLKIIENTVFAMKKTNTKDNLIAFETKLKKILKLIPLVYRRQTNSVSKTSQIILNENYNPLLAEVLNIKKEINTPLNSNHLIFTDKDVFDPIAAKKKIMDYAKTHG